MTQEEFIEEFRQNVINGVYYNMPKDYRQSDKYHSQTENQKYYQALGHPSIGRVLDDIISEYYDTINEYEQMLGY